MGWRNGVSPVRASLPCQPAAKGIKPPLPPTSPSSRPREPPSDGCCLWTGLSSARLLKKRRSEARAPVGHLESITGCVRGHRPNPSPARSTLLSRGAPAAAKGSPQFPGTHMQLETLLCHGAGSYTLKYLEGNPFGMLPPWSPGNQLWGKSSLLVKGESWLSARGEFAAARPMGLVHPLLHPSCWHPVLLQRGKPEIQK